MLRSLLPILIVTATAGTAYGADQLAVPAPKPHRTKTRTVIVAPPPATLVEPDPDSLISPMLPTTPILLGSSTLPGYYGRPFNYDYRGAYYGGPNPSYLLRLPYACGVYGYC
jgi:hypothetical protein